ncbi:hypothetical protein [Sphingomonas sp. GC_Shp_3]|uniref:hypothetical protein n=1 Tax=Sphingomonas sp. GC_Shp_3 TaxID=2937383 RepID=UPI002269D78D|nr:hypothetical protein [Sphingomonas sp. GC_Shp_3]
MADKNFFEQFDTPGAPNGVIITKPTTAKSAYETAIAQAQANNAPAIQAADARIKNAQAAELERKNAEAAADAAAAAMKPTGKMRIEDVPAAARPIVSAMLAGNLPVGARSVTSPQMLPYLQMAINVDPNFSAATFPARAAATKQLADMKSTGGYLTSLAANIDHSREEETAIQRLNNPGGWYGRMGGAALHNWLYNQGGPAGAQFDQANRVYSGEQVKSIVGNVGSAGGGSALADRQDAEKAISASMPIDAQRAALRTGAMQNYQKFRDADQAFIRTMGTHIPNALSQEQAAQLLHLMRMQEDGTEGPIPKDIDPAFVALATGGRNTPPPGAGSTPHDPNGFDPGANGGGGNVGVATGGSKTVYDQGNSAMIDRLIRAGATPAQINAALPPGTTPVDAPKVLSWQRYLKQHPDYRGSTGQSTHEEPTSFLNRVAGSGPSAAVMGAVNGATAGFSDEIGAGIGALAGGNYSQIRDDLDARKKALAKAHPYADILGNVVGGAGALALPGAAIARAGTAGILAPAAIALDSGYGALYGAGENNQNRLGGAIFGGVLGGLTGVGGRGVGAAAGLFGRSRAGQVIGQKFGDLTGHGYTPPPPALGPAERAAYSAADKAGISGIQAQLSEAQRLSLPMSLADTTPELTSLAGAAVRRSPTAAKYAKDVLEPRSLAQVDRFGHAVIRDLGPTANVPQLSQDLMTQARTAAGPLYDRAYAQPTVSTPEIDSLLATPFGRDALARAKTIIANERGSPTELGITQDAAGNPVLNPQPGAAISRSLMARQELDAAQATYRADRSPSTVALVEKAREELRQAQLAVSMSPDPNAVASAPGYHTKALDYVKQGMDDVIEQSRDQFGRLQMTPALRAQNDVKSSLLNEMDRLNPHYGDARAAYAGPMQSRDALALGGDAAKMDPQELALGVSGKTPEQLGQVQLGYRSALTGQADSMRFQRNPFDAILNTPDAESRLATVYPGNPGNANLLRQRDLEARLAQTNSEVLSGSPTAKRGIADRAFDLAAGPTLAMDASMMAMGHHAPLTTMALFGAKGLKSAYERYGQRLSVAKADDLAPLLINTDPNASAMTLNAIAARQQAYFDAVQASRRKVQVPTGMFAAAAGAQMVR